MVLLFLRNLISFNLINKVSQIQNQMVVTESYLLQDIRYKHTLDPMIFKTHIPGVRIYPSSISMTGKH